MSEYNPMPIDTSEVELSPELLELTELLAKNTHDVWGKGRIKEGWVFGPEKDSVKKTTPCLVPYEDLPEGEKEYDRQTATESLKVILSLGFRIEK